MKRTRTWQRCSCGERLDLSPDRAGNRGAVCPVCGKSLFSECDHIADQDVSGSETERVGFFDMARLAQEDIELTDVEEWDTTDQETDEDVTEEM
ncbi:MAG: hypothetical protein AB1646_08505 [Thermodesulfobacteriota bacterium]